MKRIKYRAIYAKANGEQADDQVFTVTARSINTGFAKAIRQATQGLPKGWELTKIEFWEVLS